MEFRIVDIEWEGPFDIEYDRKNDLYLFENVPEELRIKSGFYQIYGRHPVYGNDVLLYIGETKKSKGRARAFKDRLKEHLTGRFFYHTNLSLYVGPSKEDGKTIQEVESVLIEAHKPALNRNHIDSSKKCRKPLLVRNWGFVGSLNECCTSFWDDRPSPEKG